MKACSAFMVIHDICRGVKTLCHPTPVLCQLRSTKATSCFLFSALPLEMCAFTVGLVPLFIFFVSGLTVENGPQAWCELLSNFPKYTKAVMCLMEKMGIR